MRRWVVVIACWLLAWSSQSLAQTEGPVYRVAVTQGLTPPTIGLVRRALRQAEAAQAQALVIEVRNGGAVITAARALARELYAAKVPVVVWVAPRGSDGGAAAALLLAAAHVGAAAPQTRIGFAAPLVQVEGGFSPQTQQVVVDDVATELAGWQRERRRNADWIGTAARQGAILTAEQARALAPPVLDFIAATEEELLTTLQGRRVILADGSERQLATLGSTPVVVDATTWEGIAQLLALPTIAFICVVAGALAIALELTAPGTSIPGVSGAFLLLAGLYGFYQAQVRPLAVVVLLLGVILLCVEPLVMAHGGAALGGSILLVLGALWLTDASTSPGLCVAPAALVGTTLFMALGVAGLVTVALRTTRSRPATGAEGMIGELAEVRETLNPEGFVFINGALWRAWSDQGPFMPGDLVEVRGIENLRLYVVPVRVTDAPTVS